MTEIDMDDFLKTEFVKACWREDYVPGLIAAFLLVLNLFFCYSVYANVASMWFCILCLGGVLLITTINRKYLLLLSQDADMKKYDFYSIAIGIAIYYSCYAALLFFAISLWPLLV